MAEDETMPAPSIGSRWRQEGDPSGAVYVVRAAADMRVDYGIEGGPEGLHLTLPPVTFAAMMTPAED